MPRRSQGKPVAARGGVAAKIPQASTQKKKLPEEYELNLAFPETQGEHLFRSPQELFNTTLRLFSRMLHRLRKTSASTGDQAFRRRKVSNQMAGRKLRLVPYQPGRYSLATYETILHALLRSGRPDPGERLKIQPIDFLGWERQIQESLTLVLAVDVSRSTLSFKEMFARIIRSLSAHFNRHRDRIGLISVSGEQAVILNHPSRNHRVVAKSILQLNISGETPLGDGLVKSLEMVKMERTRNPGSKPVVILLSDCFPEPITHKTEDILDEPMYIRVVSAAEQFRRRRVSLLVINPSYRDENAVNVLEREHQQTPGERLTDRIIQRSGGHLIKLRTQDNKTMLHQTTHVVREDRQIQDILASIEAAFTGRRDHRDRPGFAAF